MSDHILTIDGAGRCYMPHGYRVDDPNKLPRFGEYDLQPLTVSDLARIGLERVCDPGQEGNLFGEDGR